MKELRELIKLETELTMMFDSDVRVALALLDKIREMKTKMNQCKCKIPEPRIKCSENGIDSYCDNCSKDIKN